MSNLPELSTKMFIVCHYHEIWLKGKNRIFFERKLIDNIKTALERSYFPSIERQRGRILIKLTDKGEKEADKVFDKLRDIFGIANFSLAKSCGLEVKEIERAAFLLLKNKKFRSFRIKVKRSDKTFPLTSLQMNERVGDYVLGKIRTAKFEGQIKRPIKVDLEKPDLTVFAEITEKEALLYTEKIKGAGGLPMDTGGKAAVLLSGGIDSPVAAYFTARRGVRLLFLHFHSFPFTDKKSLDKVEKIVSLFKKFQSNCRLYLIPFNDIQKEILLKSPAELRVVLYRRSMMKIGELIAEKEKAQCLVTGESIGQVASQTLENIRAIEEAVKIPVLRPLIGFDKDEIIEKAKAIGTYEISILPHQDCCSRFLPAHPETKAKLEEVKAAEKKINLGKFIRKAFSKLEIKDF